MQKTLRFIFAGMSILLIISILIIIKQHETTSLFNGRTEEMDVEMLQPLVLPLNTEDFLSALPLLNAEDPVQTGKTYLYRASNEFMFLKAGHYVVICTDNDFTGILSDKYLTYDAVSGACEIRLNGGLYKGRMEIIDKKAVVCAGQDYERKLKSITVKE